MDGYVLYLATILCEESEAHANVEVRTGAHSSIQPATHFASVGSSVHGKLVLALLLTKRRMWWGDNQRWVHARALMLAQASWVVEQRQRPLSKGQPASLMQPMLSLLNIKQCLLAFKCDTSSPLINIHPPKKEILVTVCNTAVQGQGTCCACLFGFLIQSKHNM